MTLTETYTLLQDAFNTVFERTDIPVTPELTARDVIGWDSVQQLELIMEIEDRLGIAFDGAKLEGLHNVGDLARLVLATHAEHSGPQAA